MLSTLLGLGSSGLLVYIGYVFLKEGVSIYKNSKKGDK